VFAAPRPEGHVVLDMAASLFSYGKIESHSLSGEPLPFPGGIDSSGTITDDAAEIMKTGLPLPMGYWKGSGLAIMVDLMTAILSGGNATHDLLKPRDEHGPSQVFLAFSVDRLGGNDMAGNLAGEIIDYVHTAEPVVPDGKVYYPGERTLMTRNENLEKGIPVNETIWQRITEM